MARSKEEFREMTVRADSVQIAKNIRITVKGRSNMTLFPDLFLIDFYNLSDQDYSILKRAKKIEVTGEKKSLMLSGELEDLYSHRGGNNSMLTATVSDGKTLWEKTINKSVGGGSGVRSAIAALLDGYPFGAFIADDVRFPRGQAFTGKAPPHISMLAKTANGRAFVTRGMVHVVRKGSASITTELKEDDVLNSPTGAEGVYMIRTKMRGYLVGTYVKLEGKKYRLVAQSIEMDNFEGPWRSELTMIDESFLSVTGMEGG